MKLQELQSELARLQELETQSRNYQKRSRDSLEGELKFHKEEIADLWTKKIQDAAKKEIDWVMMPTDLVLDGILLTTLLL